MDACLATEFTLLKAFPNPFNPETTILYNIPEGSSATLSVFDITGREVAVLAEGWHNAGNHRKKFNGYGLSTGIYYVQLTNDHSANIHKILLVK